MTKKLFKQVGDKLVELTKKEIAAMEKAQAEAASVEHQQMRELDYPKLGDQLDALWHAMDKGTLPKVPEFYDPIKAVKDKYKKPE